MKCKNIKGEHFGRLIAIEPTNYRKNRCVVWRCICSCGKEVLVSIANLKQGNTKSCGCLKQEVVGKLNKLRQTKNIVNKKFGRLTALKPTKKRDNGYIVWLCKCDCGRRNVYVNLHNLVSKNTLSCGCLNSEVASNNAVKNINKFREKNYVKGTRLDILNNYKIRKDNSTGCTGVYFVKKNKRYVAQIEFQGKRYYLGSSKSKEEAIKMRKNAEKNIYGNFFKYYKLRKI